MSDNKRTKREDVQDRVRSFASDYCDCEPEEFAGSWDLSDPEMFAILKGKLADYFDEQQVDESVTEYIVGVVNDLEAMAALSQFVDNSDYKMPLDDILDLDDESGKKARAILSQGGHPDTREWLDMLHMALKAISKEK